MPWSVVQTHLNAARVAGDNLARQGFNFYNPRYARKVVSARGRVTDQIFQLFPDYLFVAVVDGWRSLKSTIGVRQVLMAESEKPGLLSDDVITELRAREGDDGLVVMSSRFALGQRVEVKAGPFNFELGIYDGQKDEERVYVLMSLLGAQRRLIMKERDLIAV